MYSSFTRTKAKHFEVLETFKKTWIKYNLLQGLIVFVSPIEPWKLMCICQFFVVTLATSPFTDIINMYKGVSPFGLQDK